MPFLGRPAALRPDAWLAVNGFPAEPPLELLGADHGLPAGCGAPGSPTPALSMEEPGASHAGLCLERAFTGELLVGPAAPGAGEALPPLAAPPGTGAVGSHHARAVGR